MKQASTGAWRLTVVKLGGSLLDDAALRATTLAEIAARWKAGDRLVLVHGGGKHIDAAMAQAGIAKRTHAGLRITDDATLAIVVSVLAGHVNKMLVSELTALGVNAAGISGCDGQTLVATKHPPIDGVDLGHVGLVTSSDRGLIRAILNAGSMPVISSVAAGEDGALFNVNADAAAAAIAAAVGARDLRFLTDVAGLLDERGAVVPHLDVNGLEAMLASPAVTGGMKPKLEAALTALRHGVSHITIGAPAENSRVPAKGGTTLVAA